ncbi:MAG TPA: HlyD family efflux transporter periplasmic adaptor subunit [Chroococcales cyanobacterium]
MKAGKVSLAFLLGVAVLAGCAKTDVQFLGSGSLEAREVTITAKSQGQLLSLSAEEGQTVKKGQRLGQIENDRLLAQREELNARLSGLEVASKRAAINKSQLMESHLFAEKNYERSKTLYEAESAPRQNLDNTATQEKTTRIALSAADLSFAEIAVQRKQLEASRKVLDINIRDTGILAPRNGVITKKYIEAGELANPGSPICQIADMSDLWVQVYLGEKTLEKVRLNSKVLVTAGERQTPGRIVWISPKAEFTPKQVQTQEVNATLVYATKVRLEQNDNWRIGMPVEVRLP